jgi:hypothetical protein
MRYPGRRSLRELALGWPALHLRCEAGVSAMAVALNLRQVPLQ